MEAEGYKREPQARIVFSPLVIFTELASQRQQTDYTVWRRFRLACYRLLTAEEELKNS